MDNFKLITFIEGIESVWQSGPRKDATSVVFLTLMPGVEYGCGMKILCRSGLSPFWVVGL